MTKRAQNQLPLWARAQHQHTDGALHPIMGLHKNPVTKAAHNIEIETRRVSVNREIYRALRQG